VKNDGERRRRSFAGLMAAGILLSVAFLSWFGYRAILEWQRNSRLLAERHATEAASLLVTAVSRDMRAVGESLLRSSLWNEAMLAPPYDITNLLASTFARYPYPESFFGWRGTLTASTLVFFHRADRLPAWVVSSGGSGRMPIRITEGPTDTEQLIERIAHNRKAGGEFSVFELEIEGAIYQIVTRLVYQDRYREHVVAGLGFTVNLDWARRSYFQKFTDQVGRIAGTVEDLSLVIVDDQRRRVTGQEPRPVRAPLLARPFPLLFVDPLLVWPDRPPDLPHRDWIIQVEAADSNHSLISTNPNPIILLLVVAISAGAFALGLAMISRAARASARLADLRSDFVASVTHELKTPLATLRTLGASVEAGQVTDPDVLREYGQIVVDESKRLTRLVDNILTYAHIADVTEAYHFEPLDVRELVDDTLRRFRSQLATRGFAVSVDIPADLPLVYADRAAMGLMLENVIDNGIRYSGAARSVGIRAEQVNGFLGLTVSDRGIGIPAHELDQVSRKFFRGRGAGSGGSGLGLAIVEQIISAHGGRLAIDSREGAGTDVRVTLPIAEGCR
jgi:signal transduction histidine kinase